MNEKELLAAQAKLAEDQAALEAEKEKIKATDNTEFEEKLKNNEVTIKALQDKLNAKKAKDKTKPKDVVDAFDPEAFKNELATSMADQIAAGIKAGLEASAEGNKQADLVTKIQALDKDFVADGFSTVALEKYHNAIKNQAKVNEQNAQTKTGRIFSSKTNADNDPILAGILASRAKAKGGK